ncbi:MAG: STAS domain-containing protein [Candidatus Omnitrophica bacterium]|nr:STAS domain-containing protein [Candidatus Omnitrophota bacterium]
MEPKFLVNYSNEIVKIELSGRLDASNASVLQEELKKIIGSPVERLVFYAHNLEYISSAGLRVIIFAKQKIGLNAQVYFIGAKDMVLDTIKMSGLDTFMTIQDSYTE